MDERDRIIASIADHECKRIARRVVRALQGMTREMQSGNDSGLANLWDEVCVQMQWEQSVLWDFYEETIKKMIEKHIEALSPEIKKAVWLQTENGFDWLFDRDYDHERKVELLARVSTLAEVLSLVREHAQQTDINLGSLILVLWDVQDEARERLQEYQKVGEGEGTEVNDIPYSHEDIVDHILKDFVLRLAADWENRRIEKFIDQGREIA